MKKLSKVSETVHVTETERAENNEEDQILMSAFVQSWVEDWSDDDDYPESWNK